MDFRIGYGYDLHQLVAGRPCIIGGVEIPYEKGPAGHSDADVLLHAITDAMLGAIALGDIGTHFPDTDSRWAGADSSELIRQVSRMVMERGWKIGNIDSTVIAEKPALQPFMMKIRRSISVHLGIDTGDVSVKATTSERLGPVGEGKGIAAHAVVLLKTES
ncbi:MAG: 2-C-methyl-D-erythritol 2,4-cyclodiphosphate synthase [Balneolaceae bacterium]